MRCANRLLGYQYASRHRPAEVTNQPGRSSEERAVLVITLPPLSWVRAMGSHAPRLLWTPTGSWRQCLREDSHGHCRMCRRLIRFASQGTMTSVRTQWAMSFANLCLVKPRSFELCAVASATTSVPLRRLPSRTRGLPSQRTPGRHTAFAQPLIRLVSGGCSATVEAAGAEVTHR